MIAAIAELFLLSDHSDRSDHMETGLYGNHFPAIAELFFAAIKATTAIVAVIWLNGPHIKEKHVVLLRKKSNSKNKQKPKKLGKAN